MPKVRPLYANFTAGELSPRLRGRLDLQHYFNGCETLRNMIVWSQGGVTSRPGTKYICNTYYDSPARLIPFVFSQDEAYVLELTYQIIRIIKDGSLIMREDTPSLSYIINTPYEAGDLADIQYCQSADILYLFHQDYPVMQVVRFSDRVWGCVPMSRRDGPYLDLNTSETTLTITTSGKKCNNKGIAISANNDRVVAVGSDGIINSTDDSITWTQRTSGTNKTLNRVRWLSGDGGNFVAVGNAGKNVYSSDGISWHDWSTADAIVWRDICYAVNNDRYIIVGAGPKIYRSVGAPGVGAWTGVSLSAGIGDLYGIAYRQQGTLDQMVAVGENGTIITCEDAGQTWTIRNSGVTADLKSVAYITWLGSWVAVGDVGTILVSTDRITWVDHSCGISQTLRGISEYRICGDDGVAISINPDYSIVYSIEFGLTLNDIIRFYDYTLGLEGGYREIAVGDEGLLCYPLEADPIRAVVTGAVHASDDLFLEPVSVGRHLRWTYKVSKTYFWGWGVIRGWSSTTDVVIDVRSGSNSDGASVDWRLGLWFTENYPRCGTFHEQRMFAAATKLHTQTVFSSRSGDYRDWSPTDSEGKVPDDCAITATLVAAESNEILWLAVQKYLIVGSSTGPWVLSGGSSPLSPINFTAIKPAAYGIASVPPIVIGNSVIFTQRHGKKVREAQYDFQVEALLARDITILAEHITSGVIKEMALVSDPDPILWIVTVSGDLLTLCYEKDNNVLAWSAHDLPSGILAEHVAVIPGDGRDDVYIIFNVGGSKRHIVKIEASDYESDITDAFFVDDGIKYSGALTTTITGLGHLEGKTVSILADGLVQASKVINAGSITLDTAASKAVVGLPYSQTFKTMALEGGDPRGSSQGGFKRIIQVVARILSTGHIKIGFNADKMDLVPITAGSLYTGDKFIDFPNGWDRSQYIYAFNDQPLPMSIAGLVIEMEASAR